MQVLTQLLQKGTLDNKYFPQIVYAGCALAIYTFMLIPLSTLTGLVLPPIPIGVAESQIFWTSWSVLVGGGALQRSVTKSHISRQL